MISHGPSLVDLIAANWPPPIGVAAAVLAALVLVSCLAARRYGWSTVLTIWILSALGLIGMIGAYVDLHLPE